jgi:16S rRNA (guanine966-N2)-methyltransferase
VKRSQPHAGPQRRATVAGVTRIVAGSLGGRRLTVPAGRRTRPTSDRVREALFNTLATLTDLVGARFLDLFAGSGAVGLEALSRGAAHVLLVESHPRAVRAARANIELVGARQQVRLVTASVGATLAQGTDEPYDVVFADPPYDDLPGDQLAAMQQAILDGGWLASDGLVVLERPTRSAPPEWVKSVTEVRRRRYGETTLWYGRRS